VQALVHHLRDLHATDFTESGFATSIIDLTVTSNDGKRVEKASIAKGTKNPIAKRDGDASLYVLDSGEIENLHKLLNDLKTQG